MLAKVVYEVGKNDASQSLHFYHIFNPTFLPNNENLSVWDHHVVCMYAFGALHSSIWTGWLIFLQCLIWMSDH